MEAPLHLPADVADHLTDLAGGHLGGRRHLADRLHHLLRAILSGIGHALDLLAGLATLLGRDAEADHRSQDGAVDETSNVPHD
jgi:hypothetical protein